MNMCMNTYLWDSNHSIRIIFLLLREKDVILFQCKCSQQRLRLVSLHTLFLIKAQYKCIVVECYFQFLGRIGTYILSKRIVMWDLLRLTLTNLLFYMTQQ